MTKPQQYQTGLAILLGVTFGIVQFDRSAINLLAPLIVPALKLSNTQLGLAASVVSLTWAISGYLVGRVSDARGRRKPYLILAAIAFSLCSIASGLAGGFLMLVLARLLMGLGEGPVPALGTAMVFDASSEHRIGLNSGIFIFFAGLGGSVLAPLIIVPLGAWFDWRIAFYLAGIPGFVAAIAIAFYVREPIAPLADARAPRAPVWDILKIRNIWLSALVSSLLLASLVDTLIFTPLLLVRERHLTAGDMGMVMTVIGMVGLLGSLALPALSDRLGRKTVLITFAPLGMALPLACFYWTGSVAGLAALCGLAGVVVALPMLSIGIIPAESAGARNRVAAVGLVMGAAEICGGFAAPAITGMAADHFRLLAAPLIAGGCALAAGLLSLCLKETAPALLGPRPIGPSVPAAILPD